MIKRISCVALLVAVTSADARFGSRPLADVVKRSPLIADVTITSSRAEEWIGTRLQGKVCGTVYTARVNEVLKGEAQTSITFASDDEYEPSSRQLLLLYSSSGDFPKDVTEHLPEAQERDFQRCLKSLPELKTDSLGRVSFLNDTYVELGYLLVAPPDLHPQAISITEVEVNGKRERFPGVWKRRSEEADALLRHHLEAVVLSWKDLREWIIKRTSADAR